MIVFPPGLTDEEEALQKKFAKLKKKKKALMALKKQQSSTSQVNQGGIKRSISDQPVVDTATATEQAKMLVKTGAISAIKAENKNSGFKRSRTLEGKLKDPEKGPAPTFQPFQRSISADDDSQEDYTSVMSEEHEYRHFSRWSYDEITFLLERVLHCKEVKVLMDSSTKASHHIYRRLSRQLIVGGYYRSAIQIRSKFKNLRISFYRTILLAGQNPHETKKCPFFDDIKEIWDAVGRPQPHGGIHFSLGLSAKNNIVPSTSSVPVRGEDTEAIDDGNVDSLVRNNQAQMSIMTSEQHREILALLQDHSDRLRALEKKLHSRYYMRERRSKKTVKEG